MGDEPVLPTEEGESGEVHGPQARADPRRCAPGAPTPVDNRLEDAPVDVWRLAPTGGTGAATGCNAGLVLVGTPVEHG